VCAEGNHCLVKFFLRNTASVDQISHIPKTNSTKINFTSSISPLLNSSSSSSSSGHAQTPVSALYSSLSFNLSSASSYITSQSVGALTPLCVACFAGYDEICTLLILHGARVNFISPNSMINLVNSKKEIYLN
jgi:ankyrin repeat protein